MAKILGASVHIIATLKALQIKLPMRGALDG